MPRAPVRSVGGMTADAMTPGTDRLDRRALALAVIALTGAIVSAVIVGATIGPMEAAHGRLLSDTPTWYQGIVWALGASQAAWAALGIAGLVAGIVARGRRGGGARAVVAILLAVLGPAAAGGAFLLALLVGAAAA